MTAFRYWTANVLLEVLRRVYPGRREGVWQIIEVPRRLSKTEARDIEEQVKNL